MSNDPKKPARTDKAAKASDLLDELNSVSDMLGDAADDVPAAALSEDDVPLLAADDNQSGDGDSQNQIPLLGADGDATSATDTTPPPSRLATLARERDNPFLPRSKLDELAHSQSQTDQSLRELNPDRPRPAAPAVPVTSAKPETDTSADTARIVDELVAEWLPRIERELRERLTRALRNKP